MCAITKTNRFIWIKEYSALNKSAFQLPLKCKSIFTWSFSIWMDGWMDRTIERFVENTKNNTHQLSLNLQWIVQSHFQNGNCVTNLWWVYRPPPAQTLSPMHLKTYDLNVIYGQTVEKYYVQGQVNAQKQYTLQALKCSIKLNKLNAVVAAVAFALRFQK